VAAKTYNQVQSDYKMMDIYEYILQQTGPVSGTQIAKGVEMSHQTVMSHLMPLVARKWVKQTGELYEPGLRIMGMYSAYKMGLIGERDALDRKLALLEA
jgi:DNA-binding IclR family transcriptional regulator